MISIWMAFVGCFARVISVLAPVTLLITSHTAHATPPDAIDVTDQLFGISKTHLFVLRQTDDNLGQYSTSARHVFLVAIDLKTRDEEYWSLFLARRGERFDEAGNSVGLVTQRENRPVEINPYDILGQRRALPLGPRLQLGPYAREAMLTANETLVSVSYRDGTVYRLARKDVNAALEASNRNLSQRVWEPPRISRQYSTKQVFADRRVALESCEFAIEGRIWIGSDKPRIQLARATCRDEDETGVTSLVFCPA